MTTSSSGFLTEAQLDRVNLKTMAQGGLPAPYTEGDIFGALKVTQEWHLTEGPVEVTKEEALQLAVDWYCTNDNNTVVEAFERLKDNNLYKVTHELVTLINENPKAWAAFLESEGLTDPE